MGVATFTIATHATRKDRSERGTVSRLCLLPSDCPNRRDIDLGFSCCLDRSWRPTGSRVRDSDPRASRPTRGRTTAALARGLLLRLAGSSFGILVRFSEVLTPHVGLPLAV